MWSLVRKRTADNDVINDNQVLETLTIDWKVNPNSKEVKKQDFRAGEKIQLQSDWQCEMKHNEKTSYWSFALKRVQDQTSYNKTKELKATFSVEMLNPKDKSPGRILALNANLKEANEFGWLKFLHSKQENIYKFEDGNLNLKMVFTLLGPGPKQESTDSQTGSDQNQVKKDGEEPLCKKQKLDKFMDTAWNRCTDELFQAMSDKYMSDVTIKTSDGKEIEAHRFVLGARSEYFNGAFASLDPVSKKCELSVAEDYEIMKIVVCHMYNGSLGEVKAELVTKLVEASNKYHLKDLNNFLTEYHSTT